MSEQARTTARLECGSDANDVVDRAREGHSTPHEQACPFCQDAIRDDRLAQDIAGLLVAEERDQVVPDALLAGVMRSVWSDLRRARKIPLETPGGTAFVTENAIATVIERDLADLPDVRMHSCSAVLDTTSEAPGLRLTIGAAVAYDCDMRAVAAHARDIVRRVVAGQFGWTTAGVDIDIVDVFQREEGA